ncbi:hypothetical protein AB0G79_27140 [Streptomyces sp. NPDC020807]|uniref:hypothetical protein n=1 Tax=Streptomyces sp. NPDC020807 TaxID=3155119 RepID=UPI0033C1B979
MPASPATQSSASRAPAPQEPGPEPSPAISRLGKTKIVTVGDVEIRATRGESGILVACSLTNSADRTRSIKVKVSVGDGREWVATNEFDFPRVPAGGVASQSTVMGASRPGELPDDPKVYVDAVLPY